MDRQRVRDVQHVAELFILPILKPESAGAVLSKFLINHPFWVVIAIANCRIALQYEYANPAK
jgi:hypothetical protein